MKKELKKGKAHMKTKRGFTLVELIVVIAIIIALMGALVVNFLGSTESARNAQCMANMKQLAQGVQSYGRDTHWYPLAGSVERMAIDETGNFRNGKVQGRYNELRGWISWNSHGTYRSKPRAHAASAGWFISAYNQDETTREYCITNGVLWGHVNKTRKCYTCPNHLKKMKSSEQPNWSYVMNSVFGWDTSIGSDYFSEFYYGEREFGTLARIDKMLLFAELPWEDFFDGVQPDYSSGSGIKNDCTLQYTEGEYIGFNHKQGNNIYAHVVFADGHTDKIRAPKNGLKVDALKKLTEYLCEGKDYTYNGSSYSEAK